MDAILSPGVTDAVVGISLTVGERGGETWTPDASPGEYAVPQGRAPRASLIGWRVRVSGEELVHASRAPRCEFEQDLARAQDPQFCIDYVGEIMNNLIESEAKLMPSATYMDTVPPPVHANTTCPSAPTARAVPPLATPVADSW